MPFRYVLHGQLDSLLYARGKMIFINHPCACVPAQESIVITDRTNGFCFFEPIHRLVKALIRLMAAPGRSARELSFGPTLCQDATVISMFVIAFNFSENFFRLCIAHTVVLAESIRHCQ